MKLLLFQNHLLLVNGSAEVIGIVFNFLQCWIFKLRVQFFQSGQYSFQSNYSLCLERFCILALHFHVFNVFQPLKKNHSLKWGQENKKNDLIKMI